MLSRLFKKRKKVTSASIAKERLQIIVAHERSKHLGNGQPDFLMALQQDILEVVRKYISINSDQIKVAMDKEDGCDVLELNILLLDQDESGKPVAQNADNEHSLSNDEIKSEE